MQEAVATRYPYYALVPKERRANLIWRLAVCRRAMRDVEFREALRQMCADDPLFFVQAMCWVFEPRNTPPAPKVLPFILWPHQERAAMTIMDCWGVRDVVVLKSRTQGASWLVFGALAVHSFLFHPQFAMGLLSRDEDSVDIKGNLSKLMPKMDFQLTRLPTWLRPKVQRISMQLTNQDNGAIIDGQAATGDAFSGDRKLVVAKDESGKFPKNLDHPVEDSLQHVTHCRLDIGTPRGNIGVFYDKAHDQDIVKVILDWKDNPTNNRGLYDVGPMGEIKEVDHEHNPIRPEYWAKLQDTHRRLEQRGFSINGTRRSEWYNGECLRSTPLSIEQELNMSFGKSSEKAFEQDTINRLLLPPHGTGREPQRVGRIHVSDSLEAEFLPMNGGLVKMWGPAMPDKRAYGAGVDVAFGAGGDNSSNSVLIVGDLATGEQMFEFASSAMRIPEFARLCVAVCRMYYNATLNWDSNGPGGGTFATEVTERHQYWNIHWTESAGKERTVARKMGTWNHQEEAKLDYLTQTLEDALVGDLVLRSKLTIAEFGEFGFKAGKITHLRAERTQAESAKGKAHGDRATAAAMFNLVRRAMGAMLEPTPERPPPKGEFPWRKVPWNCSANRFMAKINQTHTTRTTGPYAN